MAKKNRVSLSFSGFAEMAEKLDKLQGDLKAITEKALIEGKKVVENNLDSVVNDPNLPAHGKYSTGLTRESIDHGHDVEWKGTTGSIYVGFNFNISGLRTVFLMYGTPKMKKAQKFYDAVYGVKTRQEVSRVQKEIFEEAIKKQMEG